MKWQAGDAPQDRDTSTHLGIGAADLALAQQVGAAVGEGGVHCATMGLDDLHRAARCECQAPGNGQTAMTSPVVGKGGHCILEATSLH